MSIERSQSSPHTDAAARSNNERSSNDTREAAPREKIDKFQRLMQEKQEQQDSRPQAGTTKNSQAAAQHATEDAVAGRQAMSERGNDEALRRQHDDVELSSTSLQSMDATAMYHAQMAVRDGLPQAAPAPLNPNAFADMVERHLKQLAAGRGVGTGDGKVLLRMADATLPGTDLLLSRTADGWLLRADVRSRSSFDAIQDAAPALAKRFAERNLGVLSFDPHFHG
ncbi:MAG: hypothetical protein ACOH1R_06855 [Luteimonas sp.]